MKVQDIMRRYPTTVQPGDLVWLAAQKMVWAGIRHIPVLQNRKLVGLVSERDVAVHRARSRDGDNTKIEVIMQHQPQTAAPGDSILEVTARMAADKISCLPVIDTGVLVGIITTTDILSAQVKAALNPIPGASPTVADVMTRDVDTAHPDDHLLDAAGRMQARRIRHLPVIDGDGKVVGVLSDRDVRAAFGDPMRVLDPAAAAAMPALEELRVGDAMSRPAVTTTADRPCSEVARDFVDLYVSAVPVINDSGTLIGMLSYIDLLRGLTSPPQ